MDQEWEFIKRNRNAIVTFICGCLMFAVIYASRIDRTAFIYDEIWVSNHDTIFLATGRWVGYLFRAFLGHGPSYPISGIVSGLLLNCAILLQLKLYDIKKLWQMLAFTTLYVSCLNWSSNIGNSTMCDFFAASVTLATAAVYTMRIGGVKNIISSVIFLTLAFGCFQTSSVCFLALVLLLALRAVIGDHREVAVDLVRKAAIVGMVALSVYFVCNKCAFKCAPEDMQFIARHYQKSLVGWLQLPEMEILAACKHFAVMACQKPLACMFGLSDYVGQWLYATVWFPASLLVLRFARSHGRLRAIPASIFCIGLIYIPFLFALILLNDRGLSRYMCMAQPIVLCGLWYLGVLSDRALCRRYQKVLLIFLLGVFVKNAYDANITARNESYFYELGKQEMRDMYLLARVESPKASHQNAPFIICGIRPMPKTQRRMDGDLYPETALPFIMCEKFSIDGYASFFRLPQMRAATTDEEKVHQETLSQMPIWPALGSVKADGDVVLIKIND